MFAAASPTLWRQSLMIRKCNLRVDRRHRIKHVQRPVETLMTELLGSSHALQYPCVAPSEPPMRASTACEHAPHSYQCHVSRLCLRSVRKQSRQPNSDEAPAPATTEFFAPASTSPCMHGADEKFIRLMQ